MEASFLANLATRIRIWLDLGSFRVDKTFHLYVVDHLFLAKRII